MFATEGYLSDFIDLLARAAVCVSAHPTSSSSNTFISTNEMEQDDDWHDQHQIDV